jgi:hypothetical protein
MAGRSITLFLIDGSASGLRWAEIGLSTIKAVVVPRASLSAASSRPELKKTGVYVIAGQDLSQPGKRRVYFGEGDVVLQRLTAHSDDEKKDFWDEAIVFVSKDENLTKSHARFLEARLIALATAAKRATIENNTAPDHAGKLPEADEAEMEEFLQQIRLLMGTFGLDVLEPSMAPVTPKMPVLQSTQLPEFSFSGDGFGGKMQVNLDAGVFVVLKGSRMRPNAADGTAPSYKSLREQLIGSGVVDSSFFFTQDYSFSASTAAAQVLSGQSISGNKAWKKGNQTLGEWQQSQLSAQPSALES